MQNYIWLYFLDTFPKSQLSVIIFLLWESGGIMWSVHPVKIKSCTNYSHTGVLDILAFVRDICSWLWKSTFFPACSCPCVTKESRGLPAEWRCVYRGMPFSQTNGTELVIILFQLCVFCWKIYKKPGISSLWTSDIYLLCGGFWLKLKGCPTNTPVLSRKLPKAGFRLQLSLSQNRRLFCNRWVQVQELSVFCKFFSNLLCSLLSYNVLSCDSSSILLIITKFNVWTSL